MSAVLEGGELGFPFPKVGNPKADLGVSFFELV